MKIIIPALLKDEHGKTLLIDTLRSATSFSSNEVILITQGLQLGSEEVSEFEKLKILHSDIPLSKWGAIKRGIEEIKEEHEKVILLDADDPFDRQSLVNVFDVWSQSNSYCLLGKRKEILLNSADQLSQATRVVLEIVFNTLLLSRYPSENIILLPPSPDIQNCLYMFDVSVVRQMDFNAIENYGGEMFLFNYLIEEGVAINNVPVLSVSRNSSNYSISEIVNNLAKLPFLRGTSIEEMDCAIRMAPIVYREYFDGIVVERYGAESVFIKRCFRRVSI